MIFHLSINNYKFGFFYIPNIIKDNQRNFTQRKTLNSYVIKKKFGGFW